MNKTIIICIVAAIATISLIINSQCQAQDKTDYDYGVWVGASRGYYE